MKPLKESIFAAKKPRKDKEAFIRCRRMQAELPWKNVICLFVYTSKPYQWLQLLALMAQTRLDLIPTKNGSVIH